MKATSFDTRPLRNVNDTVSTFDAGVGNALPATHA